MNRLHIPCLALLPWCVLSFSPLLQYRHNRSSVSPAGDARPKLAVLTVGLADRLLLASKVHTVLGPTVAKGWDVDLYVSVVSRGRNNASTLRPIKNNVSAQVAEHLETVDAIKALASTGGWTLRFCELNGDVLEVDTFVQSNITGLNITRLRVWPPNASEVGKNVLRRYKATELLMHQLQDVERTHRFSYDFVLVTKDDDHWLGHFDISAFLAVSDHPKHVFSKNCQRWGGVNDKTLLYSRQAAEAVLPRLYRDFWMEEPTLNTGNTQQYLAALFKLKGVESLVVPLHRLPTCDSIWVKRYDGSFTLCQKEYAMCRKFWGCGAPLLPTGEGWEKPKFCSKPSGSWCFRPERDHGPDWRGKKVLWKLRYSLALTTTRKS